MSLDMNLIMHTQINLYLLVNILNRLERLGSVFHIGEFIRGSNQFRIKILKFREAFTCSKTRGVIKI